MKLKKLKNILERSTYNEEIDLILQEKLGLEEDSFARLYKTILELSYQDSFTLEYIMEGLSYDVSTSFYISKEDKYKMALYKLIKNIENIVLAPDYNQEEEPFIDDELVLQAESNMYGSINIVEFLKALGVLKND